ncbi:hypothetical protein [Streptomyces sp. CBMA123]|uniref:hypothetical protein n=1 Tax=Streptomyces sp. CBMA123 TaxID=1896313 RepID=UPI0016621132|nr:hypothetical protein [Streptomyces sp. CBMA123]MBD0696058.1 hypothetical protein [Streptomyces sp. CBMA123]
MDVVARVVITWMATWAALIVLLLSPMVLPERWLYYVYSPASVGLWMLSMLVGPFVTCALNRRWIRTGVWRGGRRA